MGADRIVCHCYDVSYVDIRRAMIGGARTLEDIQKITNAGTGCGACVEEIEEILASACSCTDTSMEQVIAAVKNGADTVEKVGEVTKAGTGCGRCIPLISNIIENGK